MIYVDGVTVFTSDAYKWKHPNKSITEFEVITGSPKKYKGSIRNISITAYE